MTAIKFKPTIAGLEEHMGCLVQIETPTKFVGRYNSLRTDEEGMEGVAAIQPYMADASSGWFYRKTSGEFHEFYVMDCHKAQCLRHNPFHDSPNVTDAVRQARQAVHDWLAENYPDMPRWTDHDVDIIIRLIKELNNGTNS